MTASSASSRKVRTGVSFDHNVIRELDGAVESSTELAVNRSEIVNAIVSSFFADGPSVDSVSDLIKKERHERHLRYPHRS
ncbi:MAG: hypothetical protein JRM99_06555 [Nitrososphaerota archaeon]|jgi:hypothetical protein|nr:hypothetical protein [Nitrososphaerota archaeon]MDG6919812.1 hypothetical protein [Nitrososphaerota archaeon]MDG6981446.1 hypothetical protein [Nitrososphaerota archaeon]MDG6991066.1 hypothetical protein [Nitrososphaerota archaeon]